jgi:hypothetical protein
MVRWIASLVGLAFVSPAMAGEMAASEAREFVTGKVFSYTCFNGTRGLALVHLDGSVNGSMQVQGSGPTYYGTLPAATLRVDGGRVCASLPNSIMQPCFYLERTSAESFRGSISGLGFAYCDFTRHEEHTDVVRGSGQRKPFSTRTADK